MPFIAYMMKFGFCVIKLGNSRGVSFSLSQERVNIISSMLRAEDYIKYHLKKLINIDWLIIKEMGIRGIIFISPPWTNLEFQSTSLQLCLLLL